jgi:Trypsin-co-occurring domain 1
MSIPLLVLGEWSGIEQMARPVQEVLTMETRTEIVPVRLPNGAIIQAEATQLVSPADMERPVTTLPEILKPQEFGKVMDAIEGIADTVMTTLRRIKHQEASVEFGLEIALEAGQLTALLVKGSGKANLTITLKWGEVPPPAPGT